MTLPEYTVSFLDYYPNEQTWAVVAVDHENDDPLFVFYQADEFSRLTSPNGKPSEA